MIVDVVRNDLSRVCEVGSVKVTKHAELMTLPTVHHSYSTVQGRLKAGPIDLLRAAFPAASISGAPKIEAMRVAMREEKRRRGPLHGRDRVDRRERGHGVFRCHSHGLLRERAGLLLRGMRHYGRLRFRAMSSTKAVTKRRHSCGHSVSTMM